MNNVDRMKTLLDGLETPSPVLEQMRAAHRQSERLTVWIAVAVCGWMAFLAVIVVSAMQ